MKKYLNFENVMIKPKISSVESRSQVDLTITKNRLTDWHPIPIMSANMDTVTGVRMAFELVKHNLIAVLHKYIEKEAITILFNKIDEYNEKMNTINFSKPNKEDLNFLKANGVIPKLDYELLNDYPKEKSAKAIEKHNYMVKKILLNLNQQPSQIDYRNIFISRGTNSTDKAKLQERLDYEPRIKSVCIDVANGYRKSVFAYVKDLKNSICSDKILMIGNVATPDAVLKYAKLDVDIIKCGIGPGAGCTTRVKTGVGVPQVSMILEIKKKLKKSKEFNNNEVLICSDGGCVIPGDISKAFVAGADFVMLGGMLAGHKECPGTFEVIDNKKMMRFSGMAASESQWNGVPEYGTAEGRTVFIPYKGKVKSMIYDILGGLRSTCTYTDSHSIMDLKYAKLIKSTVQENTIFVR